MEWQLSLVLIMGLLLFLFLLQLPVAFCFLGVIVIGALIWMGGFGALSLVTSSTFMSIASFSMIPVPLFIYLGDFILLSGLGLFLFDFVDAWLGRVSARLSIMTIIVGAIFGAMCGSGLAGVALLSTMFTKPLAERGYKSELIVGPIIAGGGLSIIIPPSLLGVILATQSHVSVGGLLLAGVIPGVLLAFLYIVYTLIRVKMRPELAPPAIERKYTFNEKLWELGRASSLGVIIFLLTGIIFLGIATPSEAAATGCFAVIILGFFFKRLNRQTVVKSSEGALRTTVMVLAITMFAVAFSQLLAYSGAGKGFANWAVSFIQTPLKAVIAMMIIVIIMGCFVESVALIVLLIPLFLPVLDAFSIDRLWFSLLFLINIDIGGKTPPLGLLLYVMKGIHPEFSWEEIISGMLPYLIIEVFVLGLLIAFPQIGLWLPGLASQ